MGAPPSINLIREIFSLQAIINFDLTIIIPLTLVVALAVAYTLILYSSSQQGPVSPLSHRFAVLSCRELNLLLAHSLAGLGLSLLVGLII